MPIGIAFDWFLQCGDGGADGASWVVLLVGGGWWVVLGGCEGEPCCGGWYCVYGEFVPLYSCLMHTYGAAQVAEL